MVDAKRRLIWYGVLLFLLGLITGLMEAKFSNPRMGLAAHLEGLMNGIFLIAVGAIWEQVRLSSTLETATFWTAIFGCYANWFTTTLAAIFGTSALSPITAAGHEGTIWQEWIVTIGFSIVGLTIIAASILLLWGLRRVVAVKDIKQTR